MRGWMNERECGGGVNIYLTNGTAFVEKNSVE